MGVAPLHRRGSAPVSNDGSGRDGLTLRALAQSPPVPGQPVHPCSVIPTRLARRSAPDAAGELRRWRGMGKPLLWTAGLVAGRRPTLRRVRRAPGSPCFRSTRHRPTKHLEERVHRRGRGRQLRRGVGQLRTGWKAARGVNARRFGGIVPAASGGVDTAATGGSDGNGVLEAGESVDVKTVVAERERRRADIRRRGPRASAGRPRVESPIQLVDGTGVVRYRPRRRRRSGAPIATWQSSPARVRPPTGTRRCTERLIPDAQGQAASPGPSTWARASRTCRGRARSTASSRPSCTTASPPAADLLSARRRHHARADGGLRPPGQGGRRLPAVRVHHADVHRRAGLVAPSAVGSRSWRGVARSAVVAAGTTARRPP